MSPVMQGQIADGGYTLSPDELRGLVRTSIWSALKALAQSGPLPSIPTGDGNPKAGTAAIEALISGGFAEAHPEYAPTRYQLTSRGWAVYNAWARDRADGVASWADR